ncbi:hypothetical protein [Leptodesmis sp.]|uniref:hypothetical protein n=1 Tax=Leptodesmis sp. TaxID=3100501 RepID=UPI0040534E80
MNILFTCHYNFNPNAGAIDVTLRLQQEYQRLGHQVSFYCLDDLPSRLHSLLKVAAFPQFVASHISTLNRQQGLDVVDAFTADSWFHSFLRQSKIQNPKSKIL